MSSKQFVLDTMRRQGREAALALQAKSSAMTGTEINAEDTYIPDFKEACKVKNMMDRKAGRTDGFVCKSSAGRVVRLIQNYDSNTFTGEPEELPAQWGFVWSDDPAKAKPFIASSESPYMAGNCCIEGDGIYRSLENDNVFAPSAMPSYWEFVMFVT